MPLAEVVDKYTILQLKIDRLSLSQQDTYNLKEQLEYYSEGIDTKNVRLTDKLQALYIVNSMMWDAEADIRAGLESHLGLEEIGRRALKIRDLNKKRVAIKNEISEIAGEIFKDVKVNYA